MEKTLNNNKTFVAKLQLYGCSYVAKLHFYICSQKSVLYLQEKVFCVLKKVFFVIKSVLCSQKSVLFSQSVLFSCENLFFVLKTKVVVKSFGLVRELYGLNCMKTRPGIIKNQNKPSKMADAACLTAMMVKDIEKRIDIIVIKEKKNVTKFGVKVLKGDACLHYKRN